MPAVPILCSLLDLEIDIPLCFFAICAYELKEDTLAILVLLYIIELLIFYC